MILELGKSTITEREAFILLETRLRRKPPVTEEELADYMSFAEKVNEAVIEETRKKPKADK